MQFIVTKFLMHRNMHTYQRAKLQKIFHSTKFIVKMCCRI